MIFVVIVTVTLVIAGLSSSVSVVSVSPSCALSALLKNSALLFLSLSRRFKSHFNQILAPKVFQGRHINVCLFCAHLGWIKCEILDIYNENTRTHIERYYSVHITGSSLGFCFEHVSRCYGPKSKLMLQLEKYFRVNLKIKLSWKVEFLLCFWFLVFVQINGQQALVLTASDHQLFLSKHILYIISLRSINTTNNILLPLAGGNLDIMQPRVFITFSTL